MTAAPLRRFGPSLFFLAAFAAALARVPQPAEPAFAPPPATMPALAAEYSSGLLPRAAPSAHAATLAELPDGRIAAAWFAGSREGAADVAVWFSVLGPAGWSAPRAIATREGTARATLAHVRKLGNPVLHMDGTRLHLWFVGVAVGGWAGSAIHHAVSDDGGATWSPAVKLATSPFFNISTLVRTPPLPLADGGLGLPAYHEFVAKHGEWLRLGRDGRPLDKLRMPQAREALQPAVAALDDRRALALLRDSGPGDGKVLAATTADAGRTWPMQEALPLANPNSSVALLRLPGGRLVLAANPGSGRKSLRLWHSTDEGATWREGPEVDRGDDTLDEFSYPALLLARDGRIHLAWTWRREAIRHAAFTEAWLAGENR